jgi:hypothetical protein
MKRAVEARKHVEDFMDAIRVPLCQALARAANREEADVGFETRGHATPRAVFPTQNMMQVGFRMPKDGPVRVRVAMWAWDKLHFEVKTPFPSSQSASANDAVRSLISMGFRNWRDAWLTCMLRVDDALLTSDTLQESAVDWAEQRFGEIVASGILALEAATPQTLDVDVEN